MDRRIERYLKHEGEQIPIIPERYLYSYRDERGELLFDSERKGDGFFALTPKEWAQGGYLWVYVPPGRPAQPTHAPDTYPWTLGRPKLPRPDYSPDRRDSRGERCGACGVEGVWFETGWAHGFCTRCYHDG